MDPTTTLNRLMSKDEDPMDRLEAAQALSEWLTSGGFVPMDWVTMSDREKLMVLCLATIWSLGMDETE